MDTQNREDMAAAPPRGSRKALPSQPANEAASPPRMSVLIVNRTRLARESLAYFLQGWASDLHVLAVEDIADAGKQGLDPPDIVLFNANAARVNQLVVKQVASELEAAFGRSIPTILVLEGGKAAIDELEAVRLGMRGCFPEALGAYMLMAAIRLVLSGGVFLSPQVIALLASRHASNGGRANNSVNGS